MVSSVEVYSYSDNNFEISMLQSSDNEFSNVELFEHNRLIAKYRFNYGIFAN